MRRRRVALLTALGVDNFGSGLFLPVTLVYVTRVVGLPLAVAGAIVALGTVAGLAVPPVAGPLVDRVGPGRVVIAAELLQALGVLTYLAARGPAAVAAAAVLLAAGQQLFYSSLFAPISDVAGDGPKDRPFAVAGMVRSSCFGLGSLAAAGLLSVAGPAGWRPAALAAATVLLAGAGLLFASRANALAAAAAPAGSRGRYLAAFQYAFTVPGVIAPAVVALFGVAVWLPWLLVGASAGLAVVALRVVARHLPAYALRPPVARRPPRLQSIGSRLPGN
jgi:hypothetical protein